MSAIAKYLDRYAEPESQWLDGIPSHFEQCLAIPMYRESLDTLNYFCEFACQQPGTLLIIIINRPDHDENTDWAGAIKNHLDTAVWQAQNQQLSFYPLKTKSGLLLVDRCIIGPPIPKDQGVGLARKITNDIACRLIDDDIIQCPWIFNSDADTRLPSDYFSPALSIGNQHAALLYPYKHVGEDGQATPIASQLYELSLFYYVSGLRWAGSPYAYHTLGSIMAVNYLNYAQVRGFPKRAGAEDFYLLNKLAKTGDIHSLEKPTLNIISRVSDRVPFGTGPAVRRIMDSGDYGAIPFYSPKLFHYLKAMLEFMIDLADCDNLAQALEKLEAKTTNKPLLNKALDHFDICSALSHTYQQGKTSEKRLQQLTVWFDGFKTLKFLHFIRNNGHPMLTYKTWLQAIKREDFGGSLKSKIVINFNPTDKLIK